MRRIFILFLFLPLYYLTLANNQIQVNPVSDFNWITIWLSFFFGLLFTILFRFLNVKTITIDQRSNAGLPFSGWIVFLGLNLVLRVLVQTYFFLDGNYFLKSAWIQMEHSGGVQIRMLMIFEMFLSLFSLAGTGALIYWFFGRRDIFPKMFIYYAGFYMAAIIIQLIINQVMVLPTEMMGIRRLGYIHLLRFIYAGAWIIYIAKSMQVKQTFVYPPG